MLTDMLGNKFTVGCKVARPVMFGNSPMITICEVTSIVGKSLYLDKSKQPIRLPKRLLIIEQDPLIKILHDYDKDDTNE